jgi:hypothetical protein
LGANAAANEQAAPRAAEQAQRAEAERKAIVDAQKIVPIWNARQAGGSLVILSNDARSPTSYQRASTPRIFRPPTIVITSGPCICARSPDGEVPGGYSRSRAIAALHLTIGNAIKT